MMAINSLPLPLPVYYFGSISTLSAVTASNVRATRYSTFHYCSSSYSSNILYLTAGGFSGVAIGQLDRSCHQQ